MTIKRVSQAEWDSVYQALKGCTVTTLEIAYAVLVEGRKAVHVSNERNVTRQNIYAAVKRVTNILEEQNVDGLEAVNVLLPPDLAEKVREMAKPYMKEKKE